MNDPARKIHVYRLALAATLLAVVGACESPPKEKPVPAPTPPLATAPAPSAPAAPPAPPALPTTPPQTAPTPPADTPARTLTPVAWSELPGWAHDNHAQALPALMASCRVLAKQAVWQDICDAAPSVKGRDAAKAFFESRLTPYRVVNAEGSADGFITGYYEPVLRGSRKPSARFKFPLYALPDDLLTLDLGAATPEFSTAPRVRIEGKRVVPYHTRAAIDGEATPLRGREIAWVEDPIDLFFLQVQGSGRIELAEGGVMRVGFAGHNGHPYRSIGRVLIERGELHRDQASMQGIKAWSRANPQRLTELLNQNPRYVFFRELTGADTPPPGALGVPLTPLRSIAVDQRYVPLGAPVHIATTWPNTQKPLQRLMLAQDIGGAIRGEVRADFFWGAGEAAAREAGRMQERLRMWVLLPQGHPAAP
ncbi:MAG: transglycosylase [Betaproteobacteria bacterium]|nr:transglycosylase [Betaproteobacteria bacterium]